ncbi:DoxX family protein [Mesonia maritima]|uniref:Membrane protein YphA (DoxX/SURF4 family) n=1 Tax=Mesonia maritima TaxID=1793873 RepID=A0ABU1K3D4_9FLAO|nr:DoxX family protein [Mesonia maritima]MDR6300124.1 putative membrane protein YphA (DoxX/SURF4 family) [Mesonia maritima]
MSFLNRFEKFYIQVKQNRWVLWFSYFNRFALAVGFIAAGYVKIVDERFASGLSTLHPMGSYLTAFWHTGYYYTFVGVAQVIASILLLIPRTVTLGTLLYFPIILNIFILSCAVRFDGSLITAPLMTLSCIFLLYWNYDRLKFILPLKTPKPIKLPSTIHYSKKFPFKFFLIAFSLFVFTANIPVAMNMYMVMPRNTELYCNEQFIGTNRTTAGAEFCDCIHNEGNSLNSCLKNYEIAPNDIPSPR